MNIRNILMVVLCSCSVAAWADEFDRHIRPYLRAHCESCHGSQEQQANIRYDRLAGFSNSDRHLWTLIHGQLSDGKMPLEGSDRPEKSDTDRVLRWIEAEQRRSPAVSTRRLNRREVSAALQDVTGLNIDFAYTLPGNGKVDGFDTGAEALQDSADALAQMMQVTRDAVAGLRFLEPAPGKTYAATLREVKEARKQLDPWKSEGLSVNLGDGTTDPSLGWLMKPKWLGDRGNLSIRLPVNAKKGILRLVIEVSVHKSAPELPNPHLWVEVGERDLAYLEIGNLPDQPRTLTFEVPLSEIAADAKGVSIQLVNRVEVPYAIAGFENEEKGKPEENIPGGTGLFRPRFDAKGLPLVKQPIPLLALHRMEITLDHQLEWPPAAWQADVGERSDDRGLAQRLLLLWMQRAWRGPVEAKQAARFLALYDQRRAAGETFDAALRSAFQSVLLSGSFRFLVPPSASAEERQHALASRLSFMLWGAPPDATLSKLAVAGKLLEKDEFPRQVDRLLDDPRSEGFVRPFVWQWLELGQPITIAMDHIQKQDFRFGRNLKESMQQESVAYVARMIQENRPAAELIHSDWTMMNEILARHYGYENVRGGELRKVALRKDDPRGGGLLGQAGIQSMLCWMGDNWLIYRGSWALRRLLDHPPPPPPLEVPELIPSDAKNRGKTFRELLRQHQADEKCSVCHKRIDPVGFAFQNFDLSGRWREVEHEHYVTKELDGKIEWRGEGKTRPVDAAGKLPRGEEFQSFEQFKKLLAGKYQDDIVRGLLKNLLLYGTGRKADVEDLAEIEAILLKQRDRGYPLRDLVTSLLQTKAFMEK